MLGFWFISYLFSLQLNIYTSLFLLFQLGYELESEHLENIFWRFKAVADQKKVSKRKHPMNFEPMNLPSFYFMGEVPFEPELIGKRIRKV